MSPETVSPGSCARSGASAAAGPATETDFRKALRFTDDLLRASRLPEPAGSDLVTAKSANRPPAGPPSSPPDSPLPFPAPNREDLCQDWTFERRMLHEIGTPA